MAGTQKYPETQATFEEMCECARRAEALTHTAFDSHALSYGSTATTITVQDFRPETDFNNIPKYTDIVLVEVLEIIARTRQNKKNLKRSRSLRLSTL